MEYKGFSIEGDGNFGMKIIKPIGKGSVPKELRGRFTKTYDAQLVIDRMLAQKEEEDAKRVRRRRSKPV